MERVLRLRIEIEQEDDGRWLADVVDIRGAMAYGKTRDEAIAKAKALALQIIADEVEHGERELGGLSFETAAA